MFNLAIILWIDISSNNTASLRLTLTPYHLGKNMIISDQQKAWHIKHKLLVIRIIHMAGKYQKRFQIVRFKKFVCRMGWIKEKKIVPKEDVHWTRKYVNRCKYNPPIYTTKHTSYFVSSLQIVHIHMYKNKQTCIHTQKYNQKL